MGLAPTGKRRLVTAHTLNELRHLIEPEWDTLRARGVTALYVFGSVARDQATAVSDVDILVDYDPTSDFNLFDLAGVQRRLAARVSWPQTSMS